MGYFRSTTVIILSALLVSTAIADDWTADRLRGEVLIMQGGNWVPLARGEVVPDGGRVRTGSNGHVELLRGAESIALATNTDIVIHDTAGQQVTSVVQSRGTVTIEAEQRNVQHFSVQTPVLAAVVKGTQFTVRYVNGQASVSVDRGVVEVRDRGHETVVDVTPGQVAAASQLTPVDVTGLDAENTVFTMEGAPVPAAVRDAVLDGTIAPADALAHAQGNPPPQADRGGPGRGPDGPNGTGPNGNGPGGGPGNGPNNAGNGPGPGPGNEGRGNHGSGPREGHGPGNQGNGNGPAGNSGNGPGHGNGNSPGHGNGNGPGTGNGPGANSGDGNGRPGRGPGRGGN